MIIMKRPLTLLTLTTLAAVAFISVASPGPSPAFAEEATQISGDARFAETGECVDPEGPGAGADYALVMTGDLEGCLYTFVNPDTASSPSGTYRETGTETFVGSVFGSEEPGTFETTYRFEAKYEDVDNLAGEIFGRCQHPIVEGSGTGIFEGVTGRLDFKDDVETGTFLYRGHLQL
jgi:hypothetical protein